MKRGTVIILVVVLLAIVPLLSAQEAVNAAYQCLAEQLGNTCGNTENTENAAFSLLAMAHDGSIQRDCRDSLNDKKQDDCWGPTKTSACTLKSTALSVLALSRTGQNVDDAIAWLTEQTQPATDLEWFLEIDATNETKCTINGHTVTIKDDKKISGTNPPGLTRAYDNYWFQIQDTTKNYTISCDRDFISALLYRTTGENTFHIAADTHAAPAFDTTSEFVNATCFATNGRCDYEGSAWATLALNGEGEAIDSHIPYLIARADAQENKKYMPTAFLYLLLSGDDYFSTLVAHQKQNQYWQEGQSRLFDTALALLALQGAGIEAVANAQNYLLTVQRSDGCWQSHTAFLLYAAWPKAPILSGAGGSGGVEACVDYGHYCVPNAQCGLTDTLTNFFCPTFGAVCCTQPPEQITCAEKNGIICRSDEQCTGSKVLASDTNVCCLASCEMVQQQNDCELAGYFCNNECLSSQEEKTAYSNSCTIGRVCCGEKPSSGSSIWWILLLVILIILIILAIIFRHRLYPYWFAFKNRFSKRKPPTPPTGPRAPPNIPSRRPPMQQARPMPMHRPMQRRQPIQPRKRDIEFEETMKKLKDMSK